MGKAILCLCWWQCFKKEFSIFRYIGSSYVWNAYGWTLRDRNKYIFWNLTSTMTRAILVRAGGEQWGTGKCWFGVYVKIFVPWTTWCIITNREIMWRTLSFTLASVIISSLILLCSFSVPSHLFKTSLLSAHYVGTACSMHPPFAGLSSGYFLHLESSFPKYLVSYTPVPHLCPIFVQNFFVWYTTSFKSNLKEYLHPYDHCSFIYNS